MKLPVVSGDAAVRASGKPGMNSISSTAATDSPSQQAAMSASVHSQTHGTGQGTVRALIRDAGLSVEEFARLL